MTVSVQAIDPFNNTLHYRWAATDGAIQNTDAASTQWTLAKGPGLHFAYVLISNNKGGYTERRISVSTDNLNTGTEITQPRIFFPPALAASNRISYKALVRSAAYNSTDGRSAGIYMPEIPVYLYDTLSGNTTQIVTTDARGMFVVHDALPGAVYERYCQMEPPGGSYAACSSVDTSFTTRPREAVNDTYHGDDDDGTLAGNARNDYVGRVVLSDGKPCGIKSEFFGITSVASVSLLDANNAVIAAPYPTNVFGHYALTARPDARSLSMQCENSTTVRITATADPAITPRTVISDSAAPVVSSMSATLNGSSVGTFLPPTTHRPSDKIADAQFFLTYKGIDSRLSACKYYQATGAVKSCDSNGKPTGAITFDDWKRRVAMEPFTRDGARDVTATFINRIDLNLTRRHHSIAYAVDNMAAYVCNHLGPASDSQADVNTAINNAVNNKNQIACVAMDYMEQTGVNGNVPFTRFFVFGPTGELLTSINLDGRGEKFVPGTCVACHGGDRYAGNFPTDGTGQPDIGSHFLPYDPASFSFSQTTGLTEADQQQAIYQLNQNLLLSGPNTATRELINGWYAGGGTKVNKDYLPTSWQNTPAEAQAAYKNVYAPSCRVCHVALTEDLNFDHYPNFTFDIQHPSAVGWDGRTRAQISVCNGGSYSFLRDFAMPNSPRTYDLYHNSRGTAVDQPATLFAYLQGGTECSTPTVIPAP